MDSFLRGSGDGEEGADANPPPVMSSSDQVDMNSPEARGIVEALVNMGISRGDAELSVKQVGAHSTEAAISWVFENRDRSEMLEAARTLATMEDMSYKDYKMVFVVNTTLSMSAGKMAAQVGHGAIGLYQDLVARQDVFGGPLLQWEENGSKKIVLRAESLDQIRDLEKQAAGMPCHKVEDAGLTEVPAGSLTVLAIFGETSKVDLVTGKLKLLQ